MKKLFTVSALAFAASAALAQSSPVAWHVPSAHVPEAQREEQQSDARAQAPPVARQSAVQARLVLPGSGSQPPLQH